MDETNEIEKPENKNTDGQEFAEFIERLFPHAAPLLSKLIDQKNQQIKDQAEVAKLSHQIASRQLCFEIVLIMTVLGFTGVVIWIFIYNGKPDTAEKILFAVLGFVGGRGFIRIGKNN